MADIQKTEKTKLRLEDLPSSIEIKSILERLEKARELLSPEDKKAIQELDSLKKEARQMYKDKADRSDWLSLTETIGRSLVKLGAAQEGLRSGADLSRMQMEPATDFESKLDRARQSYVSEAQDITSQKKEIIDLAKATQASESKGLEARLNEARGRQALEAKEAGIAGLERRDRLVPKTLIDPATGKPTDYIINLDTGEQTKVGEHGYAPQTRYDPYTGELVQIGSAGTRNSISRSGTLSTPEETPTESVEQYSKLNPNQRKAVEKLRDEFATETKDVRNALGSMKGADNMIDLATTNPNASSSLGALVAKIMESGGRLTDQDVVRYTNREGIATKLQDLALKWETGTISPEKARDIKETLTTYSEALRKSLSQRAIEKSKVMESTYGIKPETVAPVVFGEYDPSWSAQTTTPSQSEFSEEDIKAVMSQYKLTREKAIQGLKLQKAKSTAPAQGVK